MIDWIRNIFSRRKAKDGETAAPQPLRISGATTTLTPEADEAEVAAEALLEILAEQGEARPRNNAKANGRNNAKANGRNNVISKYRNNDNRDNDMTKPRDNDDGGNDGTAPADQPHDAAYYRSLADRIRSAHAREARQAMRYLTYAEEQIASPLFTDALAMIERGLYPLQDCVEREGGELLRRWQHVLAEVIVRQMSQSSGTGGDDDAQPPEKVDTETPKS